VCSDRNGKNVLIIKNFVNTIRKVLF